MDWFITLFEKVFPPMSALQTWRTIMACLVLLLCFHAAWAIGWIPGLDGFAQSHQIISMQKTMEDNAEGYKNSIDKIEASQSAILARIIALDIEAARQAQCKSLAEHNSAGAQGWRVRLDAAMYEYRLTAHRDYVVRPCNEY